MVGSPDRSTITIVDDDTAPPDATEYTVSFDTASLVVDEGVGTVAVMVSITPTPFIADGDIIVPITTSISVSNAASPDDYTLPTTSSVTFSATTTEASFVVMITDDDFTEMDETITLIFDSGDLPANVVVGSPDRSTITITDNEPPPLAGDTEYTVSFTTASKTVGEGNVDVTVVVSISPTPFIVDSPIVVPITVDSSSVSSAELDIDYTLPTPSSVIFDRTTTEASFVVTITDDGKPEGDEDIVLIFDSGDLPDNVVVGSPDRSTITIIDDDVPPFAGAIDYAVFFSTVSQTVVEGDVNVEVMVFIDPPIFAMDVDRTIPIMVDDALSTAIPADYMLPNPSSVTFNEGERSKKYVVTIVDNTLWEGSKLVAFTFHTLPSNVVLPGTPGRFATHHLTVEDDEIPPTIERKVYFSAQTMTVVEGDVNVDVLVFIDPPIFAGSDPIEIPIVVDDTLTTATADDCTIPDPSSVTFNEGETSKNYVVTIVDDVDVEESESVTFTFGDLPADVMVSTDTGYSAHRLEITDNDTLLPPPPPESYVVSFITASQTVAEGTVNVTVLASISPTPFIVDSPIVVPIAVDSSVVGIVHASPDDYILPTPSNVIFDATTTEVSFEVIIIDDEVLEGNEIMVLIFDVSSLANVTAGPPDLSQIIITDNPDFRPLVDPEHARTLEDSIVVSTYPNPVVDVLHISFADFRDYEASLVTLGGISVLRQTNPTVLDMSTFAPGVYLLSLSVDGHMIVRRVVKE